jgi:ribonuclease P protein component
MRQPFRLTRSNEIKRVRRNGKSLAHPLFVLVFFPNSLAYSRFTIVTSKRVGNAVIRNRCRRRIRACVREIYPSLLPGWDILFLARQPLTMATHLELKSTIIKQLRRAGILGEINVN